MVRYISHTQKQQLLISVGLILFATICSHMLVITYIPGSASTSNPSCPYQSVAPGLPILLEDMSGLGLDELSNVLSQMTNLLLYMNHTLVAIYKEQHLQHINKEFKPQEFLISLFVMTTLFSWPIGVVMLLSTLNAILTSLVNYTVIGGAITLNITLIIMFGFLEKRLWGDYMLYPIWMMHLGMALGYLYGIFEKEEDSDGNKQKVK